jgi:menaquinol-cytochrome c reductase iron-sulfur subunit
MSGENEEKAPEEATPAAKEPEAHAEALHEPEGHPEAPPATADEIARRQLLGRMSIGVGIVCGGAISVPGVGFVVAPLFREEERVWRSVGKVAGFTIGRTEKVVFEDGSPLPWAGVTSKTAAYLRRVSETEFIAFSVNCAHLGCPVRWLEDARLFMCPCHGGVYYEDGRVAAGPPPHGLTRYPVQINHDAKGGPEVEIRTDPIPID